MGLGEDARNLARLSFLFEEFLEREHTAGALHLALKPLPEKKALLHGHCHQKAFDAVKPAQTVLGLIPELDVSLVESSCCGMAGSFGYEASHYDVRSEEHTSELQSLMRISYAVFCLKKKNKKQ